MDPLKRNRCSRVVPVVSSKSALRPTSCCRVGDVLLGGDDFLGVGERGLRGARRPAIQDERADHDEQHEDEEDADDQTGFGQLLGHDAALSIRDDMNIRKRRRGGEVG